MRVFAFSDWRSQPIGPLYDVLANMNPPPDLILYAGDDIRRFVDTTYNHFHGLAQTADAELGFVLGNDDRPEILQNLQLETSRVTDLHRNSLRVRDYGIIGQSGDIGESAMGFIQYTETQAADHLQKKYANLESDGLILVSHTPPHGTLDYAQRHNNQRIGSHAVREFATETNPAFVLCGHVHQFGGQTADTDYGPVLNVASHDFEGATGRIALIEITENQSKPDIEITHTHLQELARSISGINEALSTTSSLRTLTQIGPSRAEELREVGIESIADISTQPKEEFMSQTMIPEYCLERSHSHALAFHHDETRITDIDQYDQLRNDETVLVDIETNLEQSQVWCIGVYSFRDDEFTQLVSLDDEQSLLEDFRDYLNRQEKPTVVYYAGNSFDENRLSEAAERTNVRLSGAVSEWVDLCLLTRKTLFQPRVGHELDTIASGLGYIFAHPDITGLEIGSVYSAYQSEGEIPEEGWKKYLRYNLDDVLAIKHILDVVSESGESDDYYRGTIDETNTPSDRTQYQISIASVQDESETGTVEKSSPADTEGSKADSAISPKTGPDPYEVLDEGDPIAKWTEAKPVNKQASSAPVCSSCGLTLVEEEQRKKLSIGEETKYICRGGCSSDKSQASTKTGTERVAEYESRSETAYTTGRTPKEKSENEQVTCHDCGSTVDKQIVTGKYRINDGQTLWYCPSCA